MTPELAFFIGKGGVGKTTISAAYALRQLFQSARSRVLLVSTDPAHSLGDVLQAKLSPSETPRSLGKFTRLGVWETDSRKLFRNFLDEHRQELIGTIERGSLFNAAEISAFLDTTLPGMSEIAALLAIGDAIGLKKYSNIIVDTAPFGHTLRLFGLPRQFERLLNFLELSADRDRVLAQHFGGRVRPGSKGFVDDWRAKLENLRSAFARANVFLVTTSEPFALNQSIRCLRELRESSPQLNLRAIVLNRVVQRAGTCKACRRRAQSAMAARRILQKAFRSAELYVAEDASAPIMGVAGLRKFGAHVFDHKPLKWQPEAPKKSKPQSLHLRPDAWPVLSAPVSFVLGKGGVGKTTVSAGLAFSTRRRADEIVEICSVDPAPSLDDIFHAFIGDQPVAILGDSKLRASELDATALFKTWVGELRDGVESATSGQYSGVHVDLSYERRLFSELLEIVPPGLDEVLAVFRIVELLGPRRKVIIDMAPTGHALELLRTPERILVWARLLLKSLAAHRKLALAREAAVKIAELEVRARELSFLMKSERQAQIIAVMLPEPLPDRETERLLGELGDLGLSAAAIFVNRVLLPGMAKNCARCAVQAEWQGEVLSRLKSSLRGKQIYVLRDFDHEIAGKRGLRELTSELWRLS